MSQERENTRTTREKLLSGAPVQDSRIPVGGVSTAVLQGGEGPPIILLHGPGEFGPTWLPVFDGLTRTHRVIAPDLPGHGESDAPHQQIDADWMSRWLDELITATCLTAPVLVGRVVGGPIAARYAADYPGRLTQLVLVDTLGLVPFAPDARFGLALERFLSKPSEATYDRVMDFCAFDLDGARQRLGGRWQHYADYAVERVATPGVQAAIGAVMGLYADALPHDELRAIDVPTALIWGRQDLVTPLSAAENASELYGWPLRIVENAGDDPGLDQPAAFLDVLHETLALAGQTYLRTR